MKIYDPAAVARQAVAANPARPAMVVVHDAPDVRLVVFRLGAGQTIPVHTSVSSVVLQVLSGSGVISSAEGEHDASAGMVLAYEPQEPHGIRALTEEMIVLAAIAPRPASRRGPPE